MIRNHPAAHLVAGLVPSEDAAAGLAQIRGQLLARLARALRLSGSYAIAEIVERDGTYTQCALAMPTDAVQLGEAVGASGIGQYEGWASRWSFRFDDAAAEAMNIALDRHGSGLAASLPQAASLERALMKVPRLVERGQ